MDAPGHRHVPTYGSGGIVIPWQEPPKKPELDERLQSWVSSTLSATPAPVASDMDVASVLLLGVQEHIADMPSVTVDLRLSDVELAEANARVELYRTLLVIGAVGGAAALLWWIFNRKRGVGDTEA